MPRESVKLAHGIRTVDELDFMVATLDELLLVVDRGIDALAADVLLQRAVEGCANRIGDAIRNKIPDALLDEFRGQAYWSEWVNWRAMLMHHHRRVDTNLLWQDLVRDVPEFRRFLVDEVLS